MRKSKLGLAAVAGTVAVLLTTTTGASASVSAWTDVSNTAVNAATFVPMGATSVQEAENGVRNGYFFVATGPGTLQVYNDNVGTNWDTITTTTATIDSAVGATVAGADNFQRPYDYVKSAAGRLLVTFRTDVAGPWTGLMDSGVPDVGVTVDRGAGAVARKVTGDRGSRPYAFVVGSDGNLYTYYWDGAQLRWNKIGKPDGGTLGVSIGAAAVQQADGTRRPYVFLSSADGTRAYLAYMTDSSTEAWKWADLGTLPSGAVIKGGSGATSSGSAAGAQTPYAYMVTTNNRLVEVRLNGNDVIWFDHGVGPGTTLQTGIGATALNVGGGLRPAVAVMAGNAHPVLRYWAGTQWVWSDLGSPGGGLASAGLGIAAIRATSNDAELPELIVRGSRNAGGTDVPTPWRNVFHP